MRVLHIGDDHERGGAPENKSESDRRANCGIYAGQYLPVRNLSTRGGGDPPGFADDEIRCKRRSAMKKDLATDFVLENNTGLEPERYELHAPAVHHFEIDR